MKQHIIFSKYSVDDLRPLAENILGVSFVAAQYCVGTDFESMHVGVADDRLFFLYDRANPLPELLKRVVNAAPNIEVRSVLVGDYSRSVFSSEPNFEREAEMEMNQIMLNFVSDEGAMMWAHIKDPIFRDTEKLKVAFETYIPRIHYQSGVQVVDPVTNNAEIDVCKLLPF